MILSDLETVWGIPIISLKEYAKKHRLYSIILYLFDFLLVSVLVFAMYKKGSSFQTYMFIMVLVCIFIMMLSNTYLNPIKWQAYKFYRKFKNYNVEEVYYNVDANKLFSVIYCTGYKRVKADKSMEYYQEVMLSACCEDSYYAKNLMKYLSKYKSEENIGVKVLVITKNKKQYFIDFANSIQDLEGEDDNVREYNNSGDTEDSKTE